MKYDLKSRNFLKLLDFSPDEVTWLLGLASKLKAAKHAGNEKQRLKGKNIALIFEKTSTRTRCAFEVAAYDQGANVTYLGPSGTQIGVKETMKDTARVLARMYDAIEYRGFDQETAEELGRWGVPVWNGLTNEYHPTQVLADLMTISEHTRKSLQDTSLCFVGNGDSNMADSLLVAAAMMGMDFRIASPTSLSPDKALIEKCREMAGKTGATLSFGDDCDKALKGADFIYTDVWLSLGEDPSQWGARIELLRPYQVNKQTMAATGNPHVRFMHCLPAFHDRGTAIGEEIFEKFGLEAMEVTDDVFESEHSIVFDQAENRLHTIKAVMVATLGA